MTFNEAIAWLDASQWSGIKLGLERTRALNAALGSPEKGLRFIHVAGTNGKGSTCAFAESVARAAGLSTGLYTSPHLLDFSERIQINRKPVDREEIAAGLTRLRDAVEGWEPPPTYFELATALALLIFQRARPDLILWETGMGGRLDATNAVLPVVTAISPISFDHQKWLGQTLAEIASEKAGIFKPGIPAITAPQHPEAMAVLKERAETLGIPLHESAPGDLAPEVTLGLAGPHQRVNAALAIGALRLAGIVPEAAIIRDGLAATSWPARFQQIGGWIIDGAHNPAGAEALVAAWRERFGDRKTGAIFSALDDKDAAGILSRLAPILDELVLCPVTGSRRALSLSELLEVAGKAVGGLPARVAPHLRAAIAGFPPGDGTPRLITGSLFLCAEALRELGA